MKNGLNRVVGVYKGVSEKEVKALFMRLGGVNKLPTSVENEKYTKLNGKKALRYTVTTPNGDKITLRNFSETSEVSSAKWTLDIPVSVGKKTKIVELKFQ
ncbi:hypothetical protein [Bibersteinia trehalosi]|nr:hypothetical protein [Bibersteinia trehalosi]